VASHTWNNLRIYMEIWGPPGADVFTWMMVHDMPEIVTGDTPFGGKSYMSRDQRASLEDVEYSAVRDQLPTMGDLVHSAFELDPVLRQRAKICDLIDMLEFATVDRAMGNTLAEPIVERVGFALGQATIRLDLEDRNM